MKALTFSVEVDVRGREPVMRLAGDLDLDSSSQLRKAAAQVIGEGPPDRIVLDLADLDFIDSTGISVLVGILNRIRDEGGSELILRSPRHRVLRVIELTGFDKLVTIDDRRRALMPDNGTRARIAPSRTEVMACTACGAHLSPRADRRDTVCAVCGEPNFSLAGSAPD